MTKSIELITHRGSNRFMKLLQVSLGCLVILLVGCAEVIKPTKSNTTSYSPPLQSLLSGELLLGEPISIKDLPSADLMAVTPEMKAFANKAVAGKGDDFEKVNALHLALLKSQSAGGRGINYSRYATTTPIETFSSRQANCLGYALLFRAMATQAGLSAYINDVAVPPTWDMRDDDSMVFLRHVNVKVRLRAGRNLLKVNDEVVIDLEMKLYKAYYTQREISDSDVEAQYYSNRALEFAQLKNQRAAFLYMRKAIEVDGQQSYLWTNLASLYVRSNHLKEAELLYQHALTLNSKDMSALNNLASLYLKMNRLVEAEAYKKLVEKYRQANPYYQYFVAYKAYDQADYESALSYVRRSIKLDSKEPRFYELAHKIYAKLGRAEEAKAMQKKMTALTTSVGLM